MTVHPQAGEVRGIVFRHEGVLVDSPQVGYSVWRHEFIKRGRHLPVDYWGDLLERHPLDECDRRVLELLREHPAARPADLPGADLLDRIRRRRRRLESAQRLRPGVGRWLREAGELGIRVFVASARPLPQLDEDLTRLGIGERVEERFSFAGRAVADGYRSIAEYAGVDGAALIAVEDAPAGVRAARAAGLRCVASPQKASMHQLVPGPGLVIAEPPWLDLSGALVGLAAPAAAPPDHRPATDVARRVEASIGALALGDAIGKVVDKRSFYQLEAETTELLRRLEQRSDPLEATAFTGCVTDDTVLLLALIDCVLADGRIRRESYERRLRSVNARGGRQIYKLRADPSELSVALDGGTNGCLPRCAAVSYTHSTAELGDLCYDALKVATLTHGAPEALAAALLFSVVLAAAVEGEPVASVRDRLPALYAPLTRLAGGGGGLYELVATSLRAVGRCESAAGYVDLLEGAVGMAMAARSSAVSAICLGLSGFAFGETMAALMRRHAHWDLDSTAAIYGALAGAFQPDEIPRAWIDRVEGHCGRGFGPLSRSLTGLRSPARAP